MISMTFWTDVELSVNVYSVSENRFDSGNRASKRRVWTKKIETNFGLCERVSAWIRIYPASS